MRLPPEPPSEIRDPVHGAIRVDDDETAVIEHPFVQRLRGIRQLGFSHLPFPGATHTRYAHSLGAMHLAGLAFDAAFRGVELRDPGRREAFRSAVRLAALCHDLGHAPFSHAAEFAMPGVADLGVSAYGPSAVAARVARGELRAHHEDYTVAILTRSALAALIARRFPCSPVHVAALVSPDVAVDDGFFEDDGLDWRGVLSQLISSDLDVDRMDYLVRDSLYTGARYGQIDTHWLLSHLTRHVDDQGRVCLALDQRALFAFDDLMIARFHMFVMVYFHQKSIAAEQMLQRYMADPACDYRIPADLEAYLGVDDAALWTHLRGSPDPWARRLVAGRLVRVAVEVGGSPDEVDLRGQQARLEDAGIVVLAAEATGAVFKPPKPGSLPVYSLDRSPGRPPRAQPLHDASEVFERYQDERCVARLYVADEDLPAARALLAKA